MWIAKYTVNTSVLNADICSIPKNRFLTRRGKRLQDTTESITEIGGMEMAERFRNEDGGWFCSECGCFHDDVYDVREILRCPRCGTPLNNSSKTIDREYRLYLGNEFCKEEEYPAWLLKLRKGGDE
jgi:hypothetical protein